LFLKGERCFSPKCAMVKKPYAPGQHAKPSVAVTEYGKQLREKQVLKNVYGLREKQFKKYFKDLSKKGGKFGDLLVGRLETRLDCVAHRLGFAESRSYARQLIGHGFLQVNGRKVTIPSFNLKEGDEISFVGGKESKNCVKLVRERLTAKKPEIPAWLMLNAKDLKGKLLNIPTEREVNPDANPQAVIEFYSR